MSDAIPYSRQWISREDVDAVANQLQTPWLTQGPKVAEFEAQLTAVTGAKYAVAVASGTAALHLAALAAGVGPGKAGITSAITFVASANCIAYAGGRPAFADVDPSSGLIDIADLERRCERLAREGSAPVVIIPVDFAGQAADLPAIRVVARKYDARVIEDAAHALGASYRSDAGAVNCGSCADTDLAILSFHPVKQVTTGEGGAVLTNDRAVYTRLSELRTHGITKDPSRLTGNDGPWYYEQQQLGYHYRISDIQCALGVSQIRRLGSFLERRRALASRLDGALAQRPLAGYLRPLSTTPVTLQHAYHLYVVRVLRQSGESLVDVAERRKGLYAYLVSSDIHPQVHYIPVPRQPWFREHCGTRPEDFPGAEAYYAGCLSLPLFPAMQEHDMDRVIGALTAWANQL
jgi:perosamine synthetase